MKRDYRHERFLDRFSVTAKEVFVGDNWGYSVPLAETLVELARNEFGIREDVPKRVIYTQLSYAWRRMKKRQKTWHKGIDLVDMDIRGEDI